MKNLLPFKEVCHFLSLERSFIKELLRGMETVRTASRQSVLPVVWVSRASRGRRWRLAATVVLGVGLVLAATSWREGRRELLEGYDSGEDAALRQLYDPNGERVPGAVIAARAVADSDLPLQAESELRRRQRNLEAVERAATAAAMLEPGSKDTAATSELMTWKTARDKLRDNGQSEKPANTVKESVRQGLEEASENEESKDLMKQKLETEMRKKLSAITLDMQRQLRQGSFCSHLHYPIYIILAVALA